MRKFASIILLIVLLFNMVGYRVWFHYAEMRSDAAMESRLDKSQYDEQDLISLTIPLDNPYQLEQKSFVRVDGEISFEGKTFRYVKRKVEGGRLILLCIPDRDKMVLKKAIAEYSNLSNDLSDNTKSPLKSGLQKNCSFSDYTIHNSSLPIYTIADLHITVKHNFYKSDLTDAPKTSPGKPPKFLNLA